MVGFSMGTQTNACSLRKNSQCDWCLQKHGAKKKRFTMSIPEKKEYSNRVGFLFCLDLYYSSVNSIHGTQIFVDFVVR